MIITIGTTEIIKWSLQTKLACQAMSLDALSKEAQSWKIDTDREWSVLDTHVLALLFWHSGTAELELSERNQESISTQFSSKRV